MKRLWLIFLLLLELSLVGKAQNVTATVSDTIIACSFSGVFEFIVYHFFADEN